MFDAGTFAWESILVALWQMESEVDIRKGDGDQLRTRQELVMKEERLS